MEFDEDDYDYDVYGDTRNRKGKIEEGYNSHSKSYKEQKRIFYAKQKRQMQSEADKINNDDIEEEKVDRSKKRTLKPSVDEEDENYGNNYTPIEKKTKKKKNSKKDKIRF